MILLGEANWRIPGWLERALPRLNVEGRAARERPLERHVAREPEPV
jgi:hypothetical protein